MKNLINWFLSLFSKDKNKTSSNNVIEEVSTIQEKLQEEKMPEKVYKISKAELMAVSDPIPDSYQKAFTEFHEKINLFREKCGLPMTPTSYFRSKERQIRIYKQKAVKKEFPFEDGIYNEKKVPLSSKHMTGYAADFADVNKKLAHWVLDNIDWCKQNGFYFENFGANIDTLKWDKKYDKTPTWLHLQIIPPKSGRVIFNP